MMSIYDICFTRQEEYHANDESFFFGAWHPSSVLLLRLEGFSGTEAPKVLSGRNWFVLSNSSTQIPNNYGLLHGKTDENGDCARAVLFSGYDLDSAVHTHSASNDVFKAFADRARNINGVFSLIEIDNYGKNIRLQSDMFGISPLYYRYFDSVLIFSSSPRFLRQAEDSPDYLAWRGLIQCRFLNADRTLSHDVKRFPAGSQLLNSGDGYTLTRWIDYSTFPHGVESLDRQGVAEVEEAFQSAIDKCLRLKYGTNLLPLSSGYDSRRILTGLNRAKVDFQAATVRVFQKGYRDLDAKYSAMMAKDFGFGHKIVDLPSAEQYVKNDRYRRGILDAEASLHTWYLSLLEALPSESSLVFDGLGGDVFGNSGYENSYYYEGGKENKLKNIASIYCHGKFDRTFNLDVMPTEDEVMQDFFDQFSGLPDTLNFPEFAHLLSRTRRGVAIGVQQFLPFNHLVVFPFLDSDYVMTALKYSPLDKVEKCLQARCLDQHWPDYYKYDGNHKFSEGVCDDAVLWHRKQLVARFRQLRKEILDQDGLGHFLRLLSNQTRLIFAGSCFSNKILLSREWHLLGLMELVARQSSRSHCLQVVKVTV